MGELRKPDADELPQEEQLHDSLTLKIGSKYSRLQNAEGMQYNQFSTRNKLQIKRAYCRVEIISKESDSRVKYEVFERLNTGGEHLTEQEVRNCVIRAIKPDIADFIHELAETESFAQVVNSALSEKQINSRYNEELVLRFFAFLNRYTDFEHSMRRFISDYAIDVAEEVEEFNQELNRQLFVRVFNMIRDSEFEQPFATYTDARITAKFSPYYYDGITIAIARNINEGLDINAIKCFAGIREVKGNAEFGEHVGGGGKNTKTHTLARIEIATRILREIANA